MNTAPEWMETLESIDAIAKPYALRLESLIKKCKGHAVSIALDGTNVQDTMGRFLFRPSAPCKPGDILSHSFAVFTSKTDSHLWKLHYKILRPVPFREVKALAKFCQRHPRVEPRPGRWYEVHAD